MDFFGREAELSEICAALKSTKPEAVLVYGRRRVGKTELIRKALEGAGGLVISIEFKRASTRTNLELASSKVAAALGLPADYVFPTFDALFDHVAAASQGKRLTLVLDEFSFLLQEERSVDSALSMAIDAYKASSQLKLIVSGSHVGLMQDLIDANAPLYGRFTRIIKVEPFDYYTSSMFYESYSPQDKILMYAVFGGVPFFNSLIDPERSALDNVINLVVKKDSLLEHEVAEMILAQTSKVAGLNTVISLLGSGVCKYSDLVARLSQDKSVNPAYSLNKLQDMGIIRKKAPINDPKNKKRTIYEFADNLLHFYYRYVFRYQAERNVMDPTDFFEELVRDDFEHFYLPKKFEGVAAEGIARLSRLHRIQPVILDVGAYTFDDAKTRTNRQFDVVTRDARGYTSYECKYTDAPVGMGVIAEEEAQTADLDIDFYRLGFVSKSGFAPDVPADSYVLVSAKDLYLSSTR